MMVLFILDCCNNIVLLSDHVVVIALRINLMNWNDKEQAGLFLSVNQLVTLSVNQLVNLKDLLQDALRRRGLWFFYEYTTSPSSKMLIGVGFLKNDF